MDLIELEQLPQHNFDLRVRDQTGVDANGFLSQYYEMITGEKLDDEHISKFEKVLVGLLSSNAARLALLNELAMADVSDIDARAILEQGIVPNDEIMDKLAGIRGVLDECAEEYTEQLGDLALVAEGETAKLRLARYVVASVLVDDRESEE